MTTNFYVGDYYKDESLLEEFKEFTLNKARFNHKMKKILSKLLPEIIWNHKIDKVIHDNLLLYMREYLPKYIASFSNSNLNGILSIGINDDGFITGIPSNIPFNKELLKSHIYSIINHQLKKSPHQELTIQEKKNIVNNIDINIQLLRTDKSMFQENILQQKIEYYFKKKQRIKKALFYVIRNRNSWEKRMDKYRNLINIVRNHSTATQLSSYVKKNCTSEEYNIIFKNFWKYNKHFVLPPHDVLQLYKKRPLTMIYWLVKFKDYYTDIMNLKKPNFSKYKKDLERQLYSLERLNPLNYVYQLFPITNQIIRQNIPYYLVQFNINGTRMPSDLIFKNPYMYSQWKYKERKNTLQGPCCI